MRFTHKIQQVHIVINWPCWRLWFFRIRTFCPFHYIEFCEHLFLPFFQRLIAFKTNGSIIFLTLLSLIPNYSTNWWAPWAKKAITFGEGFADKCVGQVGGIDWHNCFLLISFGHFVNGGSKFWLWIYWFGKKGRNKGIIAIFRNTKIYQANFLQESVNPHNCCHISS